MREYVQWLADGDGEGQVFVTHSVVMWEQVRVDDNGDYIYVTYYCIPSPGSPAQSEGVAGAGLRALRRDLIDDPGVPE